MQIPLHPPIRKYLFLTVCGLAASLYFASAAVDCVAFYFAERSDLISLQRAARLEPGSAENQFRLGRYYFLVQHTPDAALDALKLATSLNPHKARYWLDLASAYQASGNQEAQTAALEHAIEVDPRTPAVAWDAGNLYLIQGETDKALQQFRVVLQNDPTMAAAALPMCWRASPSADTFLNGFLPPDPEVYFAFLDFLMARKETSAAEKVWNQLAQLQQPLRKQKVFDFVRFLLSQQEVEPASAVWRQSGSLGGLQAYQPSVDNLIVNGNFERDVLNGGFDWQYSKLKDVSLALDPVQTHSAHRSLLIDFDARSLNDAGIRQLIPVRPGTSYDFSGYFKTENLEGSGGPRFALMDVYANALLYASDELTKSDSWKQVEGTFTTGPSTKLLVLLVQRIPAGNAIKGKLWIADLRLSPKH